MTNLKFLKTLTAGIALTMAIYPQAFAGVAIQCGQQAGDTSSNCWSCGADCSARLDSTGKLSIYGSGTMKNYSWNSATSDMRAAYGNTFTTSAPWGAKIGEVTSIDVQGVTSIGNAAFIGMKRVTSFNIGDSVTTIGTYGIQDCSYSNIYLPPSVVSIGDNALSNNQNLTRVVSSIGYIVGIQTGVSSNVYYKYKQEGDLIYMYDKNNNIKGIFESQSDLKDAVLGNGQARIEYDTNGNFTVYNYNGEKIAKYDTLGNMLDGRQNRSDGSVATLKDGRLVGLRKTSPFTPAEAAALVRKGNNNTVTLTFK